MADSEAPTWQSAVGYLEVKRTRPLGSYAYELRDVMCHVLAKLHAQYPQGQLDEVHCRGIGCVPTLASAAIFGGHYSIKKR
jgi:hypothetical protein